MSTPQVADSSTGPRSRRAILAGALAAVGAAITRAAVNPLPVRAAGDDGATIHVGDLYANIQSQTTLGNQANNETVLWVASNPDLGFGNGVAITGYSAKNTGVEGQGVSGTGVYGHSTSGVGVSGQSSSTVGVRGFSGFSHGTTGQSAAGGSGVYGLSASGPGVSAESGTGPGVSALSNAAIGVDARSYAAGHPGGRGWSRNQNTGLLGSSTDFDHTPPPGKAKTGVYGHAALDSASRGVWGESPAGQGVRGQSASGSGLYGISSSGHALRTKGRVRFEKVSGVATINAGNISVTVDPGVNITSSSFVLLTPKANIGSRSLWFTTNASTNRFQIRLSSSRSSATRVAWLLVG